MVSPATQETFRWPRPPSEPPTRRHSRRSLALSHRESNRGIKHSGRSNVWPATSQSTMSKCPEVRELFFTRR
eukprot:9377605-Alexandrium_andersonii.AAC.1